MAQCIPAVRSEDIEHDSERLVYEGLQTLPDGYVILHSFPWLRPLRDLAHEPLREGEADFVVLHPDRGLLILEVKGGVPELRERTWYRNGRPMRDPFDQARRNRYALLDAIEARTHQRIHRGLLTHGDAVVFPHSRYDGVLPLNTDERILIDARGLGALAGRIDAAFAAWRRHETQLSPKQFAELQDALLPKLRLLRCAGAEVAAEGRRIVQVTLDQHAILSGLLANERVLVEGTAGSGKTLLAMDFAQTLAAAGSRVLLLCFNRHLASWLQEQVSQSGRTTSHGGTCEIATFHAFALALARRAGVEFEVPSRDAQAFWDDEVPLILEQAIEVLAVRGAPLLFDAIVVDEAQDFAPDWWVPISSLTRGGSGGRLYVFLDVQQSVRRDATLPPVPLPARFRLTTNCRNTKAIARSAAVLACVEATVLPGAPEGEEPATRHARSEAADAGIVLSEVRQLRVQQVSAKQIALIGPASHEKGALRGHHDVDGIPLVSDAAEWRRGGGILVTTARSFKGLEADIVVLYGLSSFGQTFSQTDLYVAWTRARHRLIAVCHGAEVRQTIEAALADSRLPRHT